MLDNYPPGASNDPNAPYNEPLSKESFKHFEICIKGKASIPYYTEEDLEDKTKELRDKVINAADVAEVIVSNMIIDGTIDNVFSEVW